MRRILVANSITAVVLLMFSGGSLLAQTAGLPYADHWRSGQYESIPSWLSVRAGVGAAWTQGSRNILSDVNLVGFAWEVGLVGHLNHTWAASLDLSRMSADAPAASHADGWEGFTLSNTTIAAAAIWTPLASRHFEISVNGRIGLALQSSGATALPGEKKQLLPVSHKWFGGLLYTGGELSFHAFPLPFLGVGLGVQGGVLNGFGPAWKKAPLDYTTPNQGTKGLVSALLQAGCHF